MCLTADLDGVKKRKISASTKPPNSTVTQPVCSLVPLLTKQIELSSRVAHIITSSYTSSDSTEILKCLESPLHCFRKRRLC